MFIPILAAMLFVMILSAGCGSAQMYPADHRDVINNFFSKLRDGDFESTLTYCKVGSDAYLFLEPTIEKNVLQEFAEGITLDNNKQEQIMENIYIQKWLHAYYDYMFEGFQIVDYKESRDNVIYQVSISQLNVDEWLLFGNMAGLAVFNDYFDSNQETIEQLYNEQGEEAVMIKFIEDMGEKIVEEYGKRLKNFATYSNQEYVVELQKDTLWKIVSIKNASVY